MRFFILNFIFKIKLRKKIKEFLNGYKCLTEKGTKRVDDLIYNLNFLNNFQINIIKKEINEKIIIRNDIIKGLNFYKEGTVESFAKFDKSYTINKLKKLLKKGV